MYSNAKAQHLPKSTALLYNLSYQLVLQPTAPGHILQIFLWVTIQDQIGIAQWVIIDKIVQFGLLCHGYIQRILDPGAVDGDFSPIPEQQLHTPGVHVEFAGSCIVLHVRVLSALRHLYSCDFHYAVFLMLIAHKTKFWVPTALRAGIGSQQPSHPLQRGWL